MPVAVNKFILPIVMLVLLFPCVVGASGAEKNYLHFTLNAFNPNDAAPVEWAWVTLVEIPREQAYPEEARVIGKAGGELRGTVYGLVRAAAWRSSHRYTIKTRCHDQPAEHEVFWHESWSNQVFAGGQINNPYESRYRDGSSYWVYNEIRFGFTIRPYLTEEGDWRDPKNIVNVFVGPVRIVGAPIEDIPGDFHVRSVNYDDPLVHHRRCEKAWVEQYRAEFEHFEHQNLLCQLEDGANEAFGQLSYGPRNEKTIIYEIIRSTSREHPHWKRQEM